MIWYLSFIDRRVKTFTHFWIDCFKDSFSTTEGVRLHLLCWNISRNSSLLYNFLLFILWKKRPPKGNKTKLKSYKNNSRNEGRETLNSRLRRQSLTFTKVTSFSLIRDVRREGVGINVYSVDVEFDQLSERTLPLTLSPQSQNPPVGRSSLGTKYCRRLTRLCRCHRQSAVVTVGPYVSGHGWWRK